MNANINVMYTRRTKWPLSDPCPGWPSKFCVLARCGNLLNFALLLKSPILDIHIKKYVNEQLFSMFLKLLYIKITNQSILNLLTVLEQVSAPRVQREGGRCLSALVGWPREQFVLAGLAFCGNLLCFVIAVWLNFFLYIRELFLITTEAAESR